MHPIAWERNADQLCGPFMPYLGSPGDGTSKTPGRDKRPGSATYSPSTYACRLYIWHGRQYADQQRITLKQREK